MKKHLLLLFFGILSHQFIGQVTTSVLADGDWFKFSVDTTGVFKIDKNLLQQIGVSTNNLNPKKIHIYGNGGQLLPELNSDFRYDDLQENAIYIEGEVDGVFDNNDFILFYAKGPHDWEVNAPLKTARHRQNIYSDEAYYFIKVDNDDGKRIQSSSPITTLAANLITTFDDYTFIEKDERNLIAAGTQWFYNTDLNIENKQDFTIPFSNAVAGEDIYVRVRGVSNSVVSSVLKVKVNNQDIYSLNFFGVNSGSLTKATTSERIDKISNTSNKITLSLEYDNGGNPSANTFLDYIEIIGKKELIADGNQFSFRSFEQFDATGAIEYQIRNANSISQVWDVSDFINPKVITNQGTGSNFSFKDVGASLKEYIVIGQTDFYIPKTIQDAKVVNQNLHALQDVNYLIVTIPELSDQAQRLANYHQTNSNLTTKVVMLSDIYNEFSSGSKDITGIRDFVKHVYNTNSSPDKKLKYICFFGDASYDYKDRITGNNNIVPVKLAVNSFNLASSYVTDDFYVMLEPNEGTMLSSHTIDVASSRIPVSTVSQAKDVVDKILSYYSKSSIGDWRNTITMLADDIDESGEEILQQGIETISDEIKNQKPIFNVNKIYMDAFVQQNSSGGERYRDV
ncbi:MAG: type IX secretion system sortase PorU, partial [Polaribacter sp.]